MSGYCSRKNIAVKHCTEKEAKKALTASWLDNRRNLFWIHSTTSLCIVIILVIGGKANLLHIQHTCVLSGMLFTSS